MNKMIDYIIVGNGYAGLFFAHQLIKNNKSFVIFSEDKQSASHVSAGVINPVVLKRFTSFWKAEEQIDFLKSTLIEIATYLPKNYFVEENIHRIFHDDSEKETWHKKRLNEDLIQYLDSEFQTLDLIENPFQTGVVKNSGRVDVSNFFIDFMNYFKTQNILIQEKFNHQLIDTEANTYKDISFKKIIFCEGISIKENIFFNTIPVIPNKGHFLKVKLSKPLEVNAIIKKKHFLFPLENGLHYYGGTYDPEGTGNEVDLKAKQQLIDGLKEIYHYDFEIMEFSFGYRPTVMDRRPILGSHSIHKNLFLLNGLGARGILNGSYFANHLYNHIENNTDLLSDVDLERFITI
jgi:glycine/D-amino acid oxidase-like deaminating enzyme